ncbi:MAG: glutamate--cysteine ligase [Gammaproteobacteria bacterium]
MKSQFEQRLERLAAQPNLLKGIRRGIEKESLRITPNGYLAMTKHPKALGASLTHPYITTDYSEALMEFITPPVNTPEEAIHWLMDLHTFTYPHIGNELLWTSSMPCTLTKEEDIPIADYGTSNLGRLKHIYRRGLAHRYGKSMQVISGIHLNCSYPQNFWLFYQEQLQDTQPLRDFIDQQYFSLLRNYWRYCWLIVVLTGASPALCQSFLRSPNSELQHKTGGTWYAPEGTSLLMSDLGYQNNRQHELKISYNSLHEYLSGLEKAVSILEPDYLVYGTVAEGQYEQLNANLLQIEAEYYSPIRPKRRPHSEERAMHALRDRGVEYVEVRILDLNPYEPVGITTEVIRFVESFLLMCLLKPSSPFGENEQPEIKANLRQAVYHGQNPATLLQQQGQTTTLQAWSKQLMTEIHQCAELLDQHHGGTLYQAAVSQMQEKLDQPQTLLSQQILQDMQEYHECSFSQFAYYWSQEHQKTFLQRQLSPERNAEFMQLALNSLQDQANLEKNDSLSLQEYVKKYLAAI